MDAAASGANVRGGGGDRSAPTSASPSNGRCDHRRSATGLDVLEQAIDGDRRIAARKRLATVGPGSGHWAAVALNRRWPPVAGDRAAHARRSVLQRPGVEDGADRSAGPAGGLPRPPRRHTSPARASRSLTDHLLFSSWLIRITAVPRSAFSASRQQVAGSVPGSFASRRLSWSSSAEDHDDGSLAKTHRQHHPLAHPAGELGAAEIQHHPLRARALPMRTSSDAAPRPVRAA